MSLNELHHFWFGEIDLSASYYERQLKRWFFNLDPTLDQESQAWVAKTFSPPSTPREVLAQIILLDQLPRNAFRGSKLAYAKDDEARVLCLESLEQGLEAELTLPERIFLYMPLQHSENLEHQDVSVEKFKLLHEEAPAELKSWTALGVQKALEHRVVIMEHGLFPHRAS